MWGLTPNSNISKKYISNIWWKSSNWISSIKKKKEVRILQPGGILNCENKSNVRRYDKFYIKKRSRFQEKKTSHFLWNHLFISEDLSIWIGKNEIGLIIQEIQKKKKRANGRDTSFILNHFQSMFMTIASSSK